MPQDQRAENLERAIISWSSEPPESSHEEQVQASIVRLNALFPPPPAYQYTPPSPTAHRRAYIRNLATSVEDISSDEDSKPKMPSQVPFVPSPPMLPSDPTLTLDQRLQQFRERTTTMDEYIKKMDMDNTLPWPTAAPSASPFDGAKKGEKSKEKEKEKKEEEKKEPKK